jgi:MarR family transcriptional regulator, lower aerobic nicotinate degradation pathway regulator
VTDDPLESPGYGTGVLLRIAHRHANKAFTAGLSGLDIDPRHFGVLLQLARREPLSQRQLIDLLGADKSAMVRTIDELERAGLVVRQRATHDRRAHAIVLTDAGRRRYELAEQAAIRTSELIFARLSPDEHRELHNLLRKIVEPEPARTPARAEISGAATDAEVVLQDPRSHISR